MANQRFIEYILMALVCMLKGKCERKIDFKIPAY